MALKRKNDLVNPDPTEKSGKKLRLSEEGDVVDTPSVENPPSSNAKGKEKAGEENMAQKKRIRKLAPPRPFPLVPTSVSVTGPHSAHKEGKNFICISRRNGLGAYLRRYKTLHLSAMGAAIPLLLQLSCALPPILPFSKDEIHTEVLTGTCEVQDEIIPEDDQEDIDIQSRFKSTLQVVIRIGDGQFEGDTTGPARKNPKFKHKKGKEKAQGDVWHEPEQEDDLMETV
ncbi:hypothetical protein CC1G_10828 [Coprinopsis cinerea okayama7|uniref:Uncharacterized protein n=1 Tax=Coprinopsis cinerea (strain Okayama-7 / 130 / ATCC MYA-4618 / FGSC 9003) TaxID=240176 RepID=A8NHH7_COPC7|nr:hypothetical protein CC1G_10828 [Coprinopsis cinerea okayama7\|eukprot:XP_001833763.2 hypothetical protein CC1G_10828 [Coprinopsis cinerea okayama7\